MPNNKIQDITYARVACTTRDMKQDKHRTRTTVGGNNVKHAGDVGTPTAHLEIAKMLFNSVLSRKNAKFMSIDISNFYLMTPLDEHEYLRMHVKTIPQEIIEEHNLEQLQNNGWVYVETRKGACGLPQSGLLANDLLKERLQKAGHYPTSTTPGL